MGRKRPVDLLAVPEVPDEVEEIADTAWDDLNIGNGILKVYISHVDGLMYVVPDECYAFVSYILPACYDAFSKSTSRGRAAFQDAAISTRRSFLCVNTGKTILMSLLTSVLHYINYKMLKHDELQLSNWQCLITAGRQGHWDVCAEERRTLTISEVSYVYRMYFLHVYFLSSLLFI
jgi:hypothetical protein